MQENTERRQIPYHEYRVIAHLLRAHVGQFGERLKGMVAFGNLLTRPDAYDIDLLEIIEGWEDKRFGEFDASADPGLRGKLRLYFLTPEVFENPAIVEDREERKWVEELLERVRHGYEIVTESPPESVRRILDQTGAHSTFTAPPSGSVQFADPFELSTKGQ
jgi:hypothetical protein